MSSSCDALRADIVCGHGDPVHRVPPRLCAPASERFSRTRLSDQDSVALTVATLKSRNPTEFDLDASGLRRCGVTELETTIEEYVASTLSADTLESLAWDNAEGVV